MDELNAAVKEDRKATEKSPKTPRGSERGKRNKSEHNRSGQRLYDS